MKTLTVSKADYDEILYPLVAFGRSENDGQLRVALRALEKLEDVGEPGEAAPAMCPKCSLVLPLKSVINAPEGSAVYRLSDLSVTLELEDAEAKLVAARLKEGLTQLSTTRARAIVPMLDALEAA